MKHLVCYLLVFAAGCYAGYRRVELDIRYACESTFEQKADTPLEANDARYACFTNEQMLAIQRALHAPDRM